MQDSVSKCASSILDFLDRTQDNPWVTFILAFIYVALPEVLMEILDV